MRAAAPDADLSMLRRVLDSFLFSGDSVHQPVRTLAEGPKTRPALEVLIVSGANVLLDEPTNNADSPSRGEVLAALAGTQERCCWSLTSTVQGKYCSRSASS